MLDTIPIGTAIGTSITSDIIASSLMVTMLIHQIPERIVLMVSYRKTGRNFFNFLAVCTRF